MARFLYIPQSYGENAAGLQLMPSISSFRSSPLLFEILSSIISEAFRRSNRPENISDESVNSFLSRRFGDTFSSKFGSALIHGIYAADSSQISVKAAFPSLWRAEERGLGGVMRGIFASLFRRKESESYELGCVQDLMRDVAVFSFKDGMETLTSSLENHLQNLPNITILKGTEVQMVEPSKNQTIKVILLYFMMFVALLINRKVSHSSGKPIDSTHVVSTLPLPVLSNVLHQATPFKSKIRPSIPHLRHNSSSNVCVLNLVFPCAPAEIHPEGFGYLIPRPRMGYPHTPKASYPGILGVVFDSCSLYEQDFPVVPDSYYTARHTKVTVMMGGPHPFVFPNDEDTPPLIRCVLDELRIHLSRNLPDPVYWRLWNNKECIPILLPGHLDRMEELHTFLHDSPEWDNRLAVIGAGVGGVSITDCVESARQVGCKWI